jgi:carboxyl-terminal processing protease
MVGIGIQIRIDEKKIIVVSPLENSPALKAGIRAGDIIEKIDGKSTAGITLPVAVDLIRGPKGSFVELDVLHEDGSKAHVKIERTEVRFGSVQGFRRGADDRWIYLLDKKHKIGYVQIVQFGSQTAAEVETVISDLKKDGLKGLIVDLRFCPGGLMNQAVKVADLFLADGLILTVKDNKGKTQAYRADARSVGDFPLLVLINGQTASSAEIVASALQDNSRAVLVGSRTYGKGSIQGIIPIASGGALKLTTALYFRPSGRNIQKHPGDKVWGVDPNDGFYVPLTQEQTQELQKKSQARWIVGLKNRPAVSPITPQVLTDFYADPQLAAALKAMTGRLKGEQFPKVGQPVKDLQAQIDRWEELQQRQKSLQQELQQIQQELQGLGKVLDEKKGTK